MGGRLLMRQLSRPSTNPDEINKRLDAIDFLIAHASVRLELRTLLGRCADIERIAGRIAYGNAGPRDLKALAATLSVSRRSKLLCRKAPPMKSRTISSTQPGIFIISRT